MTNRKNIKVQPDTFEQLQDMKPEGVTWDRFLKQAGRAWDLHEQQI